VVVVEEASPMTLQFLYDIGIDDVLVRPLDFTQLFWKLKMIHRLTSLVAKPGERLKIGNIEYSAENRILKDNGTQIRLTKTQAHLLDFLISHPERVITREQIREKIWHQKPISARSIDAVVSKLKGLHKDLDKRIHSVYGAGYMYSETTVATKTAN
jgi:DNA-binding response OmpR family regulator